MWKLCDKKFHFIEQCVISFTSQARGQGSCLTCETKNLRNNFHLIVGDNGCKAGRIMWWARVDLHYQCEWMINIIMGYCPIYKRLGL